jgi:trk system potassium uptake protein TrkA
MRQFAVIGLGNFGFFLAKKLHELGKEVIAIDIDKDKIQAVKDFSSQAIIADATEKEVLESIGLNDVDVVFVSMGGRMDRSILTTFYLKELGVEKVIVKAISAEHAVILEKLGADKVIFPERDMAYNLATSVTQTNVVESFFLGEDFSIVELETPDIFVGKELKELDLINKYKIQIIAIKDQLSGRINLVPGAKYKICKTDLLIIVGKNDNLKTFEKNVNKK